MNDLTARIRNELAAHGLQSSTFELILTAPDEPYAVRVYTRERVPPTLLAISSKDYRDSSGSAVIEIDLEQLVPQLLPDPPEVKLVEEVPPAPRGTSVYYIYAPYSGKIVRELPNDGLGPYLVYGQGVYESSNGKWVLVDGEDPIIFYDEDNKDFLTVMGKSTYPSLTGLRLIPGDLLIDGAKGRIYIFDGKGWDYDPRASLKGPKGDTGCSVSGYTAIRVTTDTDIPRGIRTVFADAGKGTLTLTLPKSHCLTHETPTWTICESPMVTIVNASSGEKSKIKIKAKAPDKIFGEAPTITRGKSATYQSYGGVWYLIS
jgi:hypothetical protein